MTWQEKLDDRLPMILDKRGTANLEHFISTEIIEKLIADIPDEAFLSEFNYGGNDLTGLKEKLTAKWLK